MLNSEEKLPGRLLQPVTLDNCAQEPIHIPGSIQPHGALLAGAGGTIRFASANCEAWFGKPALELLGQPLSAALNDHSFVSGELSQIPSRVETHLGRHLNLVAHASEGNWILEFEPAEAAVTFAAIYRRINAGVEGIRCARTVHELYEAAVWAVKELSAYLRIMIYQFDGEWNGRVVAEAREPRQEPFLGLHYPASDIPAQARALYLRNWLRMIPDVGYRPVEILANETRPLDLTPSFLRSVSPMHIQYLKNMGVGASMSISIIKEERLWGLIACHHDEPAFLPFEIRQGLEFLGKTFSLQLTALERSQNSDRKAALSALQPLFERNMRRESDFLLGLENADPSFLALADGVEGGAIYYRGAVRLQGATPSEDQVRRLVEWLKQDLQPVFSTDSLAELYPAAEEFRQVASGLLALSVPEVDPIYVLWFKPEVVQTVNWGGDPRKAMEPGAGGNVLGPRRSFALWQETVRLKSLPWAPEEIEAAAELRHLITEVDLEHQVKLARDSNEELDQFAYVVAHDLKEPLRGISGYAKLLKSDLAGKIGEQSLGDLEEIGDLSEKAKSLISELYEFSKLGKVSLAVSKTDLAPLVQGVIAGLEPLLAEKKARVEVKALPVLRCDRIRVPQVFQNLLTNALKYCDGAPRVEIGCDLEANPPVLYVKDNGIGIDPVDQARVFRMFERLHDSQAYGGGTGCGLPIVKRVVEKHGGRIWLASEPGAGSTFYFTLSPEASR